MSEVSPIQPIGHIPELEIVPLHRPLEATVTPPGSKSYTNRALVLAALAEGSSLLTGALFSDDPRFMAGALRDLGFELESDELAKTVRVGGGAGRVPRANAKVFIGNAGTAARFLPPLMALGPDPTSGSNEGVYEIDGTPAMRKRPAGPLLLALNALGAHASSLEHTECPPLRIASRGLNGGSLRLRGDLSSQYFTGLLMSAPYMRDGLTLEVEGDLVSKPYLEITAQAMAAFGVHLEIDRFERFRVEPGKYSATTYAIEPDASAASYFFAAAAVTAGRVIVPGLGTNSLQGDLGFVRVLEQMGCTVHMTATQTELIGTNDLRGIEVNMADISDTAQTLAAVAPFASSPTRITGIGFIRRKETDRVGAMVRELNRLGIQALEEEDGLLIHPGQPKAAKVETYDDHRMAMSFAVIGLRAPGVTILDPGCTSKTFPEYFDVLEGLRKAQG
jgi:3-phosphoshikimate 1-carboxyvinyltransferase